jgi:hypothetical protein
LTQHPLTSPHAEDPGSQVREKAPYPGRNPEGGKSGTTSGVEFVRPRNKSESWKDAVYQRSAKYYGPTSFSAVFLEHRAMASEDLLELGEDVRKHPGAWNFGQPLCMYIHIISISLVPHLFPKDFRLITSNLLIGQETQFTSTEVRKIIV